MTAPPHDDVLSGELPDPLKPLVDPRTGIVRALEVADVPDRFPVGFALVHSRLADARRFGDWAVEASGAGYGFEGVAAAAAPAVGEAVERYCGNLVPPGLFVGSWHDANRAGLEPVAPEDLCLHAADQYESPGFPFVPLTRDLRMPWAAGRRLDDGAPAALPAALVWGSLPLRGPARDAPPVSGVVQAGLAAGVTCDAAAAGALREVLERDAMVMSWQGRGGLVRLQVPPPLATLAQGPGGYLQTRFLQFAADLGVPVIGALVRDRTTGYLSLGTGCHPDPVRGAVKALGEALQLQLLLARYGDPASPIGAAGMSATSPLRPWRADRRYGLSYREDLSDVRDYGCHLQLHLDPQVQEAFEADLEGSWRGERDLGDLPCGPGTSREDLDHLLAVLGDHGMRAVAVDVTTPDVARLGLSAVRVAVPGCYGNSAAGLPLLGGGRLTERLAGRPPRVLPLPH